MNTKNSITLFNYTHCPYCIRVRMTLGYLNLNYESKVINYDDEKTPMELTGKKMLPILQQNSVTMNESIDIIRSLDTSDCLKSKEFGPETILQFENFLNSLSDSIHSLCMPYWIFTPEFSSSARQYFQTKKEKKRGPFKDLIPKRSILEEKTLSNIQLLLPQLSPYLNSPTITIKDIMLAAHCWGLYILPEFQFPAPFHHYLQSVKRITKFVYWDDFETRL